MSKPKVLFTHWDIPESAFNILSPECDIIISDERPFAVKNDIIKRVRGVEAIFLTPQVNLDKEVLDAAGPQLKVVGAMSMGLDHIDVKEVQLRGIKLGNTPKVAAGSVANLAIYLALATSRRTREARLSIENSTWYFHPHWLLGQDLYGSTVGIVGLGNIGQTIVERLRNFDVKEFIYTDVTEREEGQQLDVKFVSLDELLLKSDFVFISCPLNDETRHMFDEKAFMKMKKTAVVINTSRDDVIDQEALVKALKNNVIFAAGLDITSPEPMSPDHELLKLVNCIVMPHLGGSTFNAINGMAELTAQNILKGLNGEPLLTPVL